MQDSIELPGSDEDNQQIQFFISPNNSMKKPRLDIINTGSHQSLAYSNETHNKYHNLQKSPDQFQIPNFETSEKPERLHKLIKAGNTQIQGSPLLPQIQSDNNLFSEGIARQQIAFRKDRNKTVNKNQYSKLSKKYKQLQYAHHLQVINAEELRTKVSILTQLLQQKMIEGELSYFLKLKNSSKTKNIDIFIQLKQNQKKLKQTILIVQQQKKQLQKFKQQKRIRSANKQNLDLSNHSDPFLIIQALTQEKQSLFSYVEQVRKSYDAKEQQIRQITQQLQKHQQKQQKFITIERPKLIQEISQRSQLIKQLKQQVEQLKMEMNLMQLNYENHMQQIKNIKKVPICNQSKLSVGVMTAQISQKSIQIQTDFNNDQQILKAELKILKSERDHYIKQFKKRLNQSSQNHILRLKLQNYEQKVDNQNSC